MFDGSLCNGKLKLKSCAMGSIVRYACSMSICCDYLTKLTPEKSRELQEARMSLAKAETSKTHLEQRVEELSRKLQGDAERLAVYERRSSTTNGAVHAGTQGGSREDQLEVEVADLRYAAQCRHFMSSAFTLVSSASLKVAEVDLAAARSHIQQFKEISQANEEALASLNTTYDEYKSTTEAQLTASWVHLLHLRVYFDNSSRMPAGPTRNPSGYSEDRGAGARTNERIPGRNEAYVRQCPGGLASGQEDSGRHYRGHDKCRKESHRRQIVSRV